MHRRSAMTRNSPLEWCIWKCQGRIPPGKKSQRRDKLQNKRPYEGQPGGPNSRIPAAGVSAPSRLNTRPKLENPGSRCLSPLSTKLNKTQQSAIKTQQIKTQQSKWPADTSQTTCGPRRPVQCMAGPCLLSTAGCNSPTHSRYCS